MDNHLTKSRNRAADPLVVSAANPGMCILQQLRRWGPVALRQRALRELRHRPLRGYAGLCPDVVLGRCAHYQPTQ